MRLVKRNFAPVKRKNVTLLYIMLYSTVPAKKIKLRRNTKKKIHFKHLSKIFIPKAHEGTIILYYYLITITIICKIQENECVNFRIMDCKN